MLMIDKRVPAASLRALSLKVVFFLILAVAVISNTPTTYAQTADTQGKVVASDEDVDRVVEEIIVIGEKRDRQLQDVPVSISVVTDEDLKILPGRALADAVTIAPNVIVQNQGGRTGTYFYARGIGRSELNFPIVSVNVNGVALPDPAFFGLDLDAAEQVEFLRGPQGTLYGQNTLGGVVNITLQEPSDEYSASADFLIGERHYRETALRLEGPILGEKLKAAGTLFWNDVDGFIDNITMANSQNDERTLGGSLFVVANPVDDLRVELNYFTQERKDGLAQFPLESLFEIANDAPTKEEARSHIAGLAISYDMGSVLFESQTGLSQIDRFTQNDLDFSALSLSTATADSDIEQWSQELRLLSQNDGAFNYVVGLFGLSLENNFDVFINDFVGLHTGGTPMSLNDLVQFNDKTLAVFGQANYVFDRWEFIVGLRYQYEKIETDNTNTVYALPATPGAQPLLPVTAINGKKTYEELLPRIAATFAATDDLKLYGSISRGYRAGGFNPTALTAERAGIVGIPTSYDPEFTQNYELGVKWQLPNGLGRLDLAVFYIDWSDLQAEQIAPGSLIDFRSNSASATSVGAELEARLFPAENWELGITLGYSDAEYDEFIELFTGRDFSGNQVAGGAEMTWSTFARYERGNVFGPVGVTGNVSANGVSGRFFDSANQTAGDDYAVLNARIGLTWQSWEVFAFVRNATDELYIEYEFPGFGKFPNEPRLWGVGMEVFF